MSVEALVIGLVVIGVLLSVLISQSPLFSYMAVVCVEGVILAGMVLFSELYPRSAYKRRNVVETVINKGNCGRLSIQEKLCSKRGRLEEELGLLS